MATDSPLRQLRSQQTPCKINDDSSLVEEENSDDDAPTYKWGKHTDNSGPVLSARQTRNSNRQMEKSHTTISDHDGGESCCSANSNVENENIIDARSNNESTPQKSTSRLSRKRSTRQQSFSYHTSANGTGIKAVICRLQQSGSNTTPTIRRSSRKSTKIVPLSYIASSDDDSDCKVSSSRKRNASYFSKEDMDDYVPDKQFQEEVQTSSEDEAPEPKSSAEDSDKNESSDEDHIGKNKKLLIRKEFTKLPLTPDLLNKVEGRSVGKRIGFNSPVAMGSQTMSPNPETYFLADNRIKYRKATNTPDIMNDAMKGKRKKSRKMLLKMDNELPDRIPSDFSVTTEALKVTVNPQDFMSGNMHEEKVEQLFKSIIENEFPHWLGLFRDRFNVMIYGYGSKLPIFKAFEEFVNNQYLTVTVNGLFPKLNARKLLYGICDYCDSELRISHRVNLETVAREVAKELKTLNQSDIFILVNNFDTMALRFPQMLSVLCWLAQVPYIHILASCDTANAYLGVTQSQALQLNFSWMHCPTYQPYREEFKWSPGIYGDETKVTTQKSSLKYVLQSLTGNARKAFALLAQMQLKQIKSRAVQKAKEPYAGVRFQQLAKECREKFIAHSDEILRTLLVEFFDHHLIKQTCKGKHLENTLLIELDLETLEQIIPELA